MRAIALAALAAAMLALGAGTSGSQPAKSAPVYGIAYLRGGAELSRYDFRMRPFGRRVRVSRDAGALWAFSPDGRQLALATEQDGLQLVDLVRMRVRAQLRGRRLV